MKKKSLVVIIIIFLFLFNIGFSLSIGALNNDKPKVKLFKDFEPGEIIDISLSNKYPTLGRPIDIVITIKGNPFGKHFTELITITDEFEGLIFKSSQVKWKCGNVTLYPLEVLIGKIPIYRRKICWNPVVAGNHTFRFKAGNFSEKIKNVNVSFCKNNIIFPSMGSPSIINKNKTVELSIAISEDRKLSEEPISIVGVDLQEIKYDNSFDLDNQTFCFKTYISICENKVEDELIVRYNISEIPCGFYNIIVTTKKNEYSWPHAVKIIDNEPKDFKYVQLTDIHIGKVYNLIDEGKILSEVFDYINLEINPDFVVCSGDLVDWYNSRSPHNYFEELIEIILNCDFPVFLLPGNHDRYENRLLFLYTPFDDLSNYYSYLNPINDYAFKYGNMNFILLDSGSDYSRWEIKRNIWSPTPEGSGLTNTQFHLLVNEFGNDNLNQNIILHHPVVNYNDDYGLFYVRDDLPSGNDECIAFNRGNVIDYCINHNVSLVIAGHTHINCELNYLGEDISDPFDWPIFLQTDSTTLPDEFVGGRLIDIQNGEVLSYNYVALR